MTALEAARQLGVHKNSVMRLLRQGRFPNAVKVGGVWNIPDADVKACAKQLTARGYGKEGRANIAARLQDAAAKLQNKAARVQAELDKLKGQG